MMKGFIQILCCLLFLGNAYGSSEEKLFAEANNSYKVGDYEMAINKYEQLIRAGKKSAGLYYNLGNAYFKTNQIGRAILNYERAQRRNPDEEDIRHNLSFAKAYTKDKITAENPNPLLKLKENFLRTYSSLTWSVSGIVLIWLSLLFFALYLFVLSFRRVFFFLGSLFLISALLFFFFGRQQSAIENKCGFGVVILAKTFVKSAPSSDAADIFVLHEGTEVKILDRVDGFAKIRIADGQVGWTEMDTVASI